MTVLHTLIATLEARGARANLVGGCVRDELLGLVPNDFDIEVFNLGLADVLATLLTFGKVGINGASYQVIELRTPEGESFHISLPRRDRKVALGHGGIEATTDAGMDEKEAAARRDYTMNAISRASDGYVHDPYDGRQDLRQRILRHVSPAFAEDPLRVLRGMQFAARFGLTAAPETVALCRSLRGEYHTLSASRIWGEWEKWSRSAVPSRGLAFLYRTGWLAFYPELAALVGVPQDAAWHPEGSRLTALSAESRLARSAMPMPVDGRCFVSFREFFTAATAFDAGIEPGRGAPDAQAIDDVMVDGFTPALGAGPDGHDLASPLHQAGLAEAMSFVWHAPVAASADEGCRVVLEIPLSRVKAVMDTGVDDFQILWTIVKPIAIPVMHMLYPEQRSANQEHHNNPMNAGGAAEAGPRCIEITARIEVDGGRASVDRNVFFTFVIGAIGNADRCVHGDKYSTKRGLFQFHNGTVWTHTKHTVDEAAAIARREGLDDEAHSTLVFGALCHDMGKVTTTAVIDGRITSHGHDVAGEPLAESFMRRIGAPSRVANPTGIVRSVMALTRHHMAHVAGEPTKAMARRLITKLDADPRLLFHLIEADHNARPPLAGGLPERAARLRDHVVEIGATVPPILMGRHLIGYGWTGGPQMGRVLRAVYERQLDGEITNLAEALAAANALRAAT